MRSAERRAAKTTLDAHQRTLRHYADTRALQHHARLTPPHVVTDLPLGPNIDEMLRMIDALQFTEVHGEVCPAGWKKGDVGMKASTDGVAEYLAKHGEAL